MSDPPLQWWRLAFVAALILVLASSGLLWLRHRGDERTDHPEAAPTCAPAPPIRALRLPPERLDAPVLLAATAGVTLSLDGKAPVDEEPVRIAPGKHTLRAEKPGTPPLTFDFKLQAFDPVLLEVEPDGKFLSLVYLGADCASCVPAAVQQQLLPQEPAGAPFDELLDHAAEALASQEWAKASTFLRQVQPQERELPRFKRLAQNMLQSSGAHAEARAQLLSITGSRALDALLSSYDELSTAEGEREHQHWLARWNALTEIYERLLRLEDDAAPVLDPGSAKLAAASADFTRASKEHSAEGERDAVEAGEQVVLELLQALRAFRPNDCELQAKVTAAL